MGTEAAAAEARRLASRLHWAALPAPWRIEDYDFSAQPGADEAVIRELATLRFIDEAANVAVHRPPGRRQDDARGRPGPRRRPRPATRSCSPPARTWSAGSPRDRRAPLRLQASAPTCGRRPRPGPIRRPQPPVRNVGQRGLKCCFRTSACRYPMSHTDVGDVGMMACHGGAARSARRAADMDGDGGRSPSGRPGRGIP